VIESPTIANDNPHPCGAALKRGDESQFEIALVFGNRVTLDLCARTFGLFELLLVNGVHVTDHQVSDYRLCLGVRQPTIGGNDEVSFIDPAGRNPAFTSGDDQRRLLSHHSSVTLGSWARRARRHENQSLRAFSSHTVEVLGQIWPGVDRDSFDAYFEVQMWTRRPTGTADETNPVAARDGVAGNDPNLSHMRIQGCESVAVAEHHRVAVAVSPTRTQHDAISAGNNILSEVAVEVGAIVGPHDAENWVHPVAEGACYHPGYWPMGESETPRDAGLIGARVVICAFIGPGISLLRGQTGCLFLGEATSFLFGRYALSLGLKPLDLKRDFAVGGLDFGTNGQPLSDPFLDLVPEHLRVTLRVVEFGEAVLQTDSFSFYRSNQILGDSLSFGLLGFLGAKFVDKVVFVSDYLLA
jgi:hypothetical protein